MCESKINHVSLQKLNCRSIVWRATRRIYRISWPDSLLGRNEPHVLPMAVLHRKV